MREIALSLLLLGFVGAAAGAQSPSAPANPAASNQAMTDKAVAALEGQAVDLVDPFTVPKPLTCYWAQDHQRARCGAQVAEATLPAAKDYLQIYIAADDNEFERNKTAIDRAAKQGGNLFRAQDSLTLTMPSTGKVQLPTYCEQGLGKPDAYAFCAVGIGQHVVVEAQMANSGSPNLTADVDRARDLVAPGALYAMRQLITSSAPASASR